MAYFKHESSYVDEGAEIGEGTKIWHFCHIMSGAKIGSNCSLGQNVNVGGKAVIGNGVKIQNNVSIYDRVEIEDDVFCGPSMVFTNVINPRAFVERKTEYKKTVLKKGCSIGANATVVCGVTIGEYALVGAGSNIANTDSNYGTYAAGTLNLQAGELLGEISHKLTVAEMPSHNPQIKTNNDDWNNSPNGGKYGTTHDGANSWYNTDWYTINSGGNGAHNNIMPIEVYYIWKRVS